MTEYDLGKVTGEDGVDGATIWVTSTAPTSPDYTFTISNLTGPTGATVKAGDIIIYSYYWYSITTVSSTTVLAGNRTSIRGAAGQNGTNGTNGTNGVGISSISKTGTSGKVDTYTITYTNSNTSTFTVTNGNDGTNGTNGTNGTDGVGITSIEKTGTSGKIDTYTITYTDGDTDTFTVTNGNDGTNGTNGTDGDDGVGIASITKTGTSGLVDTYTITYTDTNTSTFTVTNGKDGSDASVTIVTSFGSTTSDSKVPSEKLVKTELDKKIATSSTTGLLKNDGSVMTSGTGSGNWAVGNHTHSAYVNPTIADNLTTNDATKVLSAKQGKVLKDLIGDAISYINQ